MGYESGAVKWMFGMLFSVQGFVSLYIFGDGIWNTITHFEALIAALTSDSAAQLIRTLITVYIPTPESLLSSLVVYPLVGGVVGAVLWYKGSKF